MIHWLPPFAHCFRGLQSRCLTLAILIHTYLPWSVVTILWTVDSRHPHSHTPTTVPVVRRHKHNPFRFWMPLALADLRFYSHSSLSAAMNPPLASTACCRWLLTSSGLLRSTCCHPCTNSLSSLTSYNWQMPISLFSPWSNFCLCRRPGVPYPTSILCKGSTSLSWSMYDSWIAGMFWVWTFENFSSFCVWDVESLRCLFAFPHVENHANVRDLSCHTCLWGQIWTGQTSCFCDLYT